MVRGQLRHGLQQPQQLVARGALGTQRRDVRRRRSAAWRGCSATRTHGLARSAGCKRARQWGWGTSCLRVASTSRSCAVGCVAIGSSGDQALLQEPELVLRVERQGVCDAQHLAEQPGSAQAMTHGEHHVDA